MPLGLASSTLRITPLSHHAIALLLLLSLPSCACVVSHLDLNANPLEGVAHHCPANNKLPLDPVCIGQTIFVSSSRCFSNLSIVSSSRLFALPLLQSCM